MNRVPLDAAQIAAALHDLPGWSWYEDRLRCTYRFSNYRDCVSMAVRIAFEAEAMNHHPEMVVSYGALTVEICTHDAGNRVTAMDVALATAIVANCAKICG